MGMSKNDNRNAENEEIDLKRCGISAQMILKQAMERGWRVRSFATNSSIFLFYIPGRAQPIQVFGTSPPKTSFAASKIAKDKCITNLLLGEAGLPVPDEIIVRSKDYDREAAEVFIAKHKKVVLKPLDGAHGRGVTVDVSSLQDLDRAIQGARSHTKMTRMILQEQLEGIDIRVVCIDYQYADAMTRSPAAVTGDGERTILELITAVNDSDDRGLNYSASLNVIPARLAQEYLGLEGLARVPATGQEVQVIGVANIGMGGVRKNIRQNVPVGLQAMAVQAAKLLQLPVCGVDFIAKKAPERTDELLVLDPKVIEVNTCPTLTMYEDLQSPEQVAIIEKYLDYVAAS